MSYPIAIADVYDPPADYPAPKGLPMTLLIGPDGEVIQKFLGPVTRKEPRNAATAARAGT